MLVSGGVVLWFLALYVLVAVLSGVTVLAIAWYGLRAVQACLRSCRDESPPPRPPSRQLTPAQARRNHEALVRMSAHEERGRRPR